MSRHPRAAGLVAAALLVALTACGERDASRSEPAPGGSSGVTAGGVADVLDGDVPAACVAAFPLVIEAADLADVTLRPADFPAPPVDGTLCQTSSTLDGNLTTADYATDASATEVLDAYEQQLGATYEVVREDRGAGENLSGDLGGGVFVQVTPGEGRYSVAFGTA